MSNNDEFKEDFLMELLENPLTRASLDLSMWAANHAGENDTEDMLLLLTQFTREIVLRVVDPSMQAIVIAELQLVLAKDSNQSEEKVAPTLRLIPNPVDQ